MEQKSHRPPTERGIPDSTTGLRPLVHRFALKMEEKLQRDDLRKGHWKKEGVSVLWACLLQEVKELEDALMSDATAEEITLECADVANLAMMVADMVGGFCGNARRAFVGYSGASAGSTVSTGLVAEELGEEYGRFG